MKKKLGKYRCPHCGNFLSTAMPLKKDVTIGKPFWDTTVRCPDCKKIHFKVICPGNHIRITFSLNKGGVGL